MMIENPHDQFRDARDPAVAGKPMRDPAGWQAQEFVANRDWLCQFTNNELLELKEAIAPYDHAGVDLTTLARADFVLPTLADRLGQVRQELLYGRGFINFRGLSVGDLGKRGAGIAFWAISHYLSDGVCSQNDRGHVLGHVTDLGESKTNASQRGPYSRESIPFHVDAADLVGLLCLEPAKSGGESSLASAVAVHNEVLRRRPDLLPVLYQPYARDRRDEIPPGMQPWYHLAVFHAHQGYFSASIEPTYMGSAHRFEEIGAMSPEQTEALSLVQEIAAETCFDMGFARGDMQFLNNHVIFHSRRGFEDYDAPEQKRHLLRVWLKALDGRPLADEYYTRHGKPGEIDRPGGIVGPDTVLSAPLTRQ